jgi:hypothetical protein
MHNRIQLVEPPALESHFRQPRPIQPAIRAHNFRPNARTIEA